MVRVLTVASELLDRGHHVVGVARIGVVGGAASLLVAEGGPRVIDAGFPQEYRAEAEAHREECTHRPCRCAWRERLDRI